MPKKKIQCTFDGVTYASLADASRALGIPTTTLRRRIDKGINSITAPRTPRNVRNSVQVFADGIVWESMAALSEHIYGHRASTRLSQYLHTHPEIVTMRDDGMRVIDVSRIVKCDHESVEIRGVCYRNLSEAAREVGLSRQTLSVRRSLGASLARVDERKTRTKVACDYYYQGVVYHGLVNACRWLHRGVAWVHKNCIEIPRYRRMDDPNEYYKMRRIYSIEIFLYGPQRWDENRIIGECDRRLKHWFAHRR